MIQYVFRLDDGQAFQFDVDTDRPASGVSGAEPHWAKLDFHRCTNCPLSPDEHPNCPAAVDAQRITETFQNMLSTQEVTVEVHTKDRVYVKRTDSQTGLRALFGLVMATSGCPILARFKGLARTHLPFATMEETILRVVGAFLIQQFLRHKEGGEPDWELKGLNEFYEQIQEVNRCFKGRIDAASQQDANMNALGSLVYLAMGVSFSLEDRLTEVREMVFGGGEA